MCNDVKIETGRNFPPVLTIVTGIAQAAQNVIVAKRARDQCSIFSIGRKLELHALTLVTCFLLTFPGRLLSSGFR